MMTSKLLLAFGLVAVANAICPNSCSGNGKCGQFDKCECHQNWQGPDCSLRTCPFELAWVDVGTDTDDAHYYAECANKGTCDRKTGECKCFDGYEGKGCRRSTCPNECSGHGTCEYIDELIEDVEHKRLKNYNKGMYHQSDYSVTNTLLVNDAASGFSQVTGKTYDLWDHQKIQGCKCDANWEGPDCSAKTCPRGDDPLTTQINTDFYSTYVDRQLLLLGRGSNANGGITNGDTFDITYYDLYGGKWVTSAITIDGTTDDNTAANIEAALRALPNRVMEGVQVYPATESKAKFGVEVQAISKDRLSSTAWDFDTGCDENNQQCFVVEFADRPGSSGVQYLLEVDGTSKNDGAGYQPVTTGFSGSACTASVHHIMEIDDMTATVTESSSHVSAAPTAAPTSIIVEQSEVNYGYTNEAAVCSGRGLCDSSTGDCECFSGYRGLACQEQEALT